MRIAKPWLKAGRKRGRWTHSKKRWSNERRSRSDHREVPAERVDEAGIPQEGRRDGLHAGPRSTPALQTARARGCGGEEACGGVGQGFNGLYSLVRDHLGEDPLSGRVFLFTTRAAPDRLRPTMPAADCT